MERGRQKPGSSSSSKAAVKPPPRQADLPRAVCRRAGGEAGRQEQNGPVKIPPQRIQREQ